MAWLLDTDPFMLLLLRGRGEQDIMGELRERRNKPAAWVPGRAAGSEAERDPRPQSNDVWPQEALDEITLDAATWASQFLKSPRQTPG